MKSEQASHEVESPSITIVDLFLNMSAEWLVVLKFCTGASVILCICYHILLSLSCISFIQEKKGKMQHNSEGNVFGSTSQFD